MKSNLTPEQSQRLIELGVDPSKASESSIVCKEPYLGASNRFCNDVMVPIFNLANLISLLPKEIDGYPLLIFSKQFFAETDEVAEGWTVLYTKNDLSAAFGDESIYSTPELIDALYELLVWCITNKHVEL